MILSIIICNYNLKETVFFLKEGNVGIFVNYGHTSLSYMIIIKMFLVIHV